MATPSGLLRLDAVSLPLPPSAPDLSKSGHLWRGQVLTRAGDFTYQAVDVAHRKYFLDLSFKVPGPDFLVNGVGLTWEDLFYTEYKVAQLNRNYFNFEELDGLRSKMLTRIKGRAKITTLSAVMGNQPKDERKSLGFCIQAVAMTHIRRCTRKGAWEGKECLHIHFQYRTTEIIKKFGADLLFLSQGVVPYLTRDLNVPVREVSFSIPSYFFSFLYLPVIWHNLAEVVSFLRFVKNYDWKAWNYSCSFLDKALTRDPEFWSYAARKRAVRDLQNSVSMGRLDAKACRVYLDEEWRKGGGKDLGGL